MKVNIEEAVVIAGGYGVVGQQAAQIIRQRHPALPLIIAGRHPEKGEALAQELTNADTFKLDVEQPQPLKGIKPRAILAAVNDPHDYLLLEAAQSGIPYLDITRWTERLQEAASRLSGESLRAPVMLSSAWMAGVAAVIGVALAHQLQRLERLDISVLYSLKDKAGPNSAEYMDRLATPFEVMLNGERKQVYPYTDSRRITFPGGYTAKAYRFDTPDQFTLPTTTRAKTVTARIAFDDKIATSLLVLLTRSGIWKLISGARFTSVRRSMLYNPGKGASHEIVIEATGIDASGNSKTLRSVVVDAKGQTHLTALGALIQLERLLGLDGAPPPVAGIVYPDTAPQIDAALQTLRTFGATVETTPNAG
ncbi:MAG: saccharopine dehydrogenase [Acidobacteria bacterium]|nr:saccharopine dehydrogenase [Acidobacteriota bacterium]